MPENSHFDLAIVGGGLAGLSLSILLAKDGKKVLLLEQNSYPFHKVCGEYISNESKYFLAHLGVEVSQMPQISKLVLTSDKHTITQTLDMGGFGVSRYYLDHKLANIAKEIGVDIRDGIAFKRFEKHEEGFTIYCEQEMFTSTLLVASFGKYTCGNFFKPKTSSKNWVGIKYHVKAKLAEDEIALHTFDGGYCGISKIENENYCLCYIVDANAMLGENKRIEELEKNVLSKNPHLAEIFNSVEKIWPQPKVISNVTFKSKKPFHEGVFYIGDCSGSIAPLTGNGMSNAMRSAYLVNPVLLRCLNNKMSLNESGNRYTRIWKRNFQFRIILGNLIHNLFCKRSYNGIFLALAKRSGLLRKMIIKQTHGSYFCKED